MVSRVPVCRQSDSALRVFGARGCRVYGLSPTTGGAGLSYYKIMRTRFDAIATVIGVIAILSAVIVFGVLSYRAPDPRQIYDPSRSGDPLPRGFRQLLARDAIRPIYDPEFVTAEATPWRDDTLIIGIAQDDEAKAYPVSFLNGREMVIDRIAGIPVLVTW